MNHSFVKKDGGFLECLTCGVTVSPWEIHKGCVENDNIEVDDGPAARTTCSLILVEKIMES